MADENDLALHRAPVPGGSTVISIVRKSAGSTALVMVKVRSCYLRRGTCQPVPLAGAAVPTYQHSYHFASSKFLR